MLLHSFLRINSLEYNSYAKFDKSQSGLDFKHNKKVKSQDKEFSKQLIFLFFINAARQSPCLVIFIFTHSSEAYLRVPMHHRTGVMPNLCVTHTLAVCKVDYFQKDWLIRILYSILHQPDVWDLVDVRYPHSAVPRGAMRLLALLHTVRLSTGIFCFSAVRRTARTHSDIHQALTTSNLENYLGSILMKCTRDANINFCRSQTCNNLATSILIISTMSAVKTWCVILNSWKMKSYEVAENTKEDYIQLTNMTRRKLWNKMDVREWI